MSNPKLKVTQSYWKEYYLTREEAEAAMVERDQIGQIWEIRIDTTHKLDEYQAILPALSYPSNDSIFEVTFSETKEESDVTKKSNLNFFELVKLINKPNRKKANTTLFNRDQLSVPFFCYNKKTQLYEFYDIGIYQKTLLTFEEQDSEDIHSSRHETYSYAANLAVRKMFDKYLVESIHKIAENYVDHFGNRMFITFDDNNFYYFVIGLRYVLSLKKDGGKIPVMHDIKVPSTIRELSMSLESYHNSFPDEEVFFASGVDERKLEQLANAYDLDSLHTKSRTKAIFFDNYKLARLFEEFAEPYHLVISEHHFVLLNEEHEVLSCLTRRKAKNISTIIDMIERSDRGNKLTPFSKDLFYALAHRTKALPL